MSAVTFVPLSKYDWGIAPALNPAAIPWNPTVYCVIAAFSAVSLWMTIELTLKVYFTFRKHNGLYFWSILITVWGVSIDTIGFMLELFSPQSNWIVTGILAKLGWVMNTTGFSIVLYSRLHLVVSDRRILRAVLGMIIVDAFLLHIPIIVLAFGLSASASWAYVRPLEIFERIQVTWFSVQETIISALYIWSTNKFLHGNYTDRARTMIVLLCSAQTLVILLDTSLVALSYRGFFTLKVIIHPFVYAVKLKIEFIVLNQLLNLVKRGLSPLSPNSFAKPDEDERSDTESCHEQNTPSPPVAADVGNLSSILHSTRQTEPTLEDKHIVKTEEYNLSWQNRFGDNNPNEHVIPSPFSLVESAEGEVPTRMTRLNSDATLWTDSRESDLEANVQSISDIEKQYLGRFGLHTAL